MSEPLYGVYGASGCGRGIMPLAREQLAAQGVGADRLVFVDDGEIDGEVNGHRVLTYNAFRDEAENGGCIAIAIGDGALRERLAATCESDGFSFWSVTADNVVIMDDVEIGEGALLSPFVTITSNIRIGRFFHANLYSYVEHDCSIGDFVTFAPGAKCNGNIIIEDHAYIGAGALLRQGKPGAPLRIGKGAVVGMGAVVTSSVPPGTNVVGNPARPLSTA
jgi:sugar O-acyltransferase (sialic acid O-acetyltransferase NeuD family)